MAEIPAVVRQLPVMGKVYIHLDNGDEWVATEEDLNDVGFYRRGIGYKAFADMLASAAGHVRGHAVNDLTREGQGLDLVNIIRYLAEVCIYQYTDPNETWMEDESEIWELREAVRALIEFQEAKT